MTRSPLLMALIRKSMTDEDWSALRFEAGQTFTPSTPIGVAELFSGRKQQIDKLLDAVAERGRHALIYGEPGVGKTSLAQTLQFFVPAKTSSVVYIRKPAFSSDTFSSIWLDIFKEIKFVADLGDGDQTYSVSDMYKEGIGPRDVVRELKHFKPNDIPIIVIDEYNLVRDKDSSKQMAETIKALSDDGINVTVMIVGISDTVEELIEGHSSIARNTEEILMPRMHTGELKLLLESRISKLGMKISGDAKWKIINLSKGLPAFAHSLGRGAVLTSIGAKKLSIEEKEVDAAITELLGSSQNTLKNDYELAIRSNQDKARFRQILTACAMANSDESGYFTPKQVQEPLAAILKKKIGIDGFNSNLKEFASLKRGGILQQIGEERIYRYRFSNPAMQPFAIMKGIQDGFLDEKAKQALSAPEQGSLFASEP